MQPRWRENGSIYVFRPWVLREERNRLGGKIAIYEMDFWSSFDLDDANDADLLEWIIETGKVSSDV
jgi:N-acylneuraminate cytidylyltransferase